MYDLVISNGDAVLGDAVVKVDLGITGERIAAIGAPGSLGGRETIEADGTYVLPGGVDPHVHIHWPWLDTSTSDDFFVATRAAALGGTSLVVDWAVQRNDTPLNCFRQRRAEADGQVAVDYALHGTLTQLSLDTLDSIPALVEAGVTVLKLYMTYRRRGILADDAMLWEVMQRAARLGIVVSVHAENASIHEWNQQVLEAQGRHEAIDFARHKGGIVEPEAINRALYIAREAGATLLIRHISTARAVALVREAKGRGQNVYAETTTHYLVLTEEVYERPDGRLFICSPPIKSAADRAALWEGLVDGTIDFIGADHAAFSRPQKESAASAFDVPNGLPGIETRFPLVYSEGFAKGRLSLPRLAALTATNAARFYGVYPAKGALQVGSDADVVLVDPRRQSTITSGALSMGVDWTPYEGLTLHGGPRTLVVRGQVVVRDGAFRGAAGYGRFVPMGRRRPRVVIQGGA